jgi:hypothetical protein
MKATIKHFVYKHKKEMKYKYYVFYNTMQKAFTFKFLQ